MLVQMCIIYAGGVCVFVCVYGVTRITGQDQTPPGSWHSGRPCRAEDCPSRQKHVKEPSSPRWTPYLGERNSSSAVLMDGTPVFHVLGGGGGAVGAFADGPLNSDHT